MITSHNQIKSDGIKVRAVTAAIGDIAIDYIETRPVTGYDVTYDTTVSTTYTTVAEAEQMIVALARHLFDTGTMSMQTAETLSYLSGIVLQDPREYEQAAADHAYDEIHDGWVTDEV